MINLDIDEKNNVKMLGIMVRYNRVKQGYSLRDLAKITNISHTLISNFEKGLIIPHIDTIKDIFDKLNLKFFDSPDISEKFNKYYDKILNHILFYEYAEASKLIKEIEIDRDIYEHSVVLINFAIIRCLYYTITNLFSSDRDQLIDEFEVVLDFFSPHQKQLFYFIRGLDYLNKEEYKNSRNEMEKAINIGDFGLDLLIKEHYVITLSKAGKYVDAARIASQSITKFEMETNYIRAMRLRTRIAIDYIRINKFNDAKRLFNSVLGYSLKFKVHDLVNRCYTYLSYIAILENNFKLGEQYLNKVKPTYSRIYYYLKFDIAVHKNNEEDLLKLYNEYTSYDWVQNSKKAKNFYEMILMRFSEKFMDKAKYIKNAKELIEHGYRNDDLIMIEVSCKMLSDIYKQDRHYKDALETQEKYLHFLKYGSK